MTDQLEEIKSKIDIVEFVGQYVPLKKAGQNFKGLCPFHGEKTPSFVVSPERQIWHCFGACATGGDIFGFLMKMENLEFGEVLRILAKRAGVELKQYRPTEGERQRQLLFEINHLASEFYHYLLTSHPVGKRALEYILGRGISKESIKEFKLGFSPASWNSLQKFLVDKKKYTYQDLEKAGLISPSGRNRFYDRFRGRLMFPLKDHRGNICGFAGRVLDKNAEEAKYINSAETLLYHKSELLYGLSETKEAIKKEDAVVLVEGELDAISSYQAGVKNVVAIKGSALTREQVSLISRFTKNVIFALDADSAGKQAAKRGMDIAEEGSLVMKAISVVGGKDPDEVAQKNPELWAKLVRDALPIYDFFINDALATFDPTTAEGKRKIGQEVVPILAKINDNIVQAHYVKMLSQKLGVEEEAINSQIAKVSQPTALVKTEIISEEKVGRREVIEAHLLALAFQSKSWKLLRKRRVSALVSTSRFAKILAVLKDYLGRYKTYDSKRLAKMLPPELIETYDKLYLIPLEDLVDDEDILKKEFEKTLVELEKFQLKEKLEAVAREITLLEKQPGLSKETLEKLDKLNQDFADLARSLAEFE